ncbi:hypothetical protein ACUJ46_11930 [Sandaracinobacteroides sp. A072]
MERALPHGGISDRAGLMVLAGPGDGRLWGAIPARVGQHVG